MRLQDLPQGPQMDVLPNHPLRELLRAQYRKFIEARRPQGIGALSQQARAATGLLQALPPRYGEVLFNLLDRLESSALFTEESCSFSQKDLTDNLLLWVEKARIQLEKS